MSATGLHIARVKDIRFAATHKLLMEQSQQRYQWPSLIELLTLAIMAFVMLTGPRNNRF